MYASKSVCYAVLFLLAVLCVDSYSADITVPAGDGQGLINAISDANGNGEADRIILAPDSKYTFGLSSNFDVSSNLDCDLDTIGDQYPCVSDGNNALPAVTSDITIIGNGSILERGSSLSDCSVDGNASEKFRIFNVRSGGNLTLRDVTLQNGCAADVDDNDPPADEGGGIRNAGILEIDGVTFNNNSAGFGGAIDNLGTITSVRDSEFSGNSADFGGAIDNDGTINGIDGSTFSDNRASTSGGAIHNVISNIRIENSTFSGNSSGRLGGVIFSVGGTINIAFSTIVRNTASSRGVGGILRGRIVATEINIRNSIVAFNDGGNCADVDGNALDLGDDGNYSDDATCGFGDRGDSTITSGDLGMLADNGWTTETVALVRGNPAINGATDCRGYADATTTTIAAAYIRADQRGAPRAIGTQCDSGAVEYSYGICTPNPCAGIGGMCTFGAYTYKAQGRLVVTGLSGRCKLF